MARLSRSKSIMPTNLEDEHESFEEQLRHQSFEEQISRMPMNTVAQALDEVFNEGKYVEDGGSTLCCWCLSMAIKTAEASALKRSCVHGRSVTRLLLQDISRRPRRR